MSPADDAQVVTTQIGRPLRTTPSVVSRCHLDLPVVIEVPPYLEDGTPFPTLYWLTCPLARARIGRMESAGGVKRMERKADADPGFGARLAAAHEQYREARLPLEIAGVAGAREGVKCLHAHYAHTRGGGDNPVGEQVAGWIEPLDCPVPCVVDGEMNPEWVAGP